MPAANGTFTKIQPMDRTETHRVAIDLGDRRYEILIGSGLIDAPDSFDGLPRGRSALIVSNEMVAPLYAYRLAAALAGLYPRVGHLVLPDGEVHKDWRTLGMIFDRLLEDACDRKTVLYALGGGVVGDMTGFAAACYMRGVAYVQVPTTLLAQVDSSVGGKTAINHPAGKNMIGAFYQPTRVIADLDTLATLPPREIAAGLAEIIKYGPIADDQFFAWLENNLDALLQIDKSALAHAVRRSCEIKAWVVAQDERESGLRAILNFGHTFGHAIEAALGYGEWLHGEAVGCGMVMAADLSHRMGFIDDAYRQRITALVRRAGLPVSARALGASRYIELMRVDKKADAGKLQFVLIESPGRAGVHGVDERVLAEVIDANCA